MELVSELYDYFKAIKIITPKGDGAKLKCAKDVHKQALKIFKMLEKTSPKIKYATCLILLELAEQMILDDIDGDFIVEERDYLL